MKNFFLLIFSVIYLHSFAQNTDAQNLYSAAKNFIRIGEYDSATNYLNNALEKEPENFDMLKDLAFLNFLKRDFSGSIEICKQLSSRKEVDEQVFQMLGMNYKALAMDKELVKMYKVAFKKFPASGVLYNDFGEWYASRKEMNNAIDQWEKGIEVAPNYSSNYFNATNYYAIANNIFKEIIYGEIFLNIESYSARTAEVKALLLESYKKLYTQNDVETYGLKYSSAFAKSFFEILSKSKSLSSDGITPEILTAIRIRFVIDWFASTNQTQFPFRLFEHWQYLLREGLFEAYNQWIFGTAASPASYKVWIDTHDKQSAAFKKFQQSRIFKLPADQYYK